MTRRAPFLLAAVFLCVALPPPASAEWVTEARNPSRTGVHLGVNVQPPYRSVWTQAPGPRWIGEGGLIEHGITVAEGKVFAATINGQVTAMNASTGTILWRRDLGRNLATAPTYHQGFLYVNGRHPARLWKLEASSGRVVWRRCYRPQCDGITEGAPLIVGGAVYVTANVTNVTSFLTSYWLWGRKRWTRHACGLTFATTPTWTGRHIVFGDRCAYLRAYTVGGRLAWRTRIGWHMHAAPTYVRGRLYAHVKTGFLYAVAPRTGRILWARRTGYGWGYANCAATMLRVWCANGWGDNVLTAWNRYGRRVWRRSVPGYVMGAVSLTRKMLWVATYGSSSYILGINPGTGRTRVRFRGGRYDPIAASGSTIYLIRRATIEAIRER